MIDLFNYFTCEKTPKKAIDDNYCGHEIKC